MKLKLKKKHFKYCLPLGVLTIITLSILTPVFYMFFMSIRTRRDIMLEPLGFPKSFDLTNYKVVLENLPYVRNIINTLGITIAVIVLVTIFASLAAYALVRIKGKISNFIYIFITLGLIIPPFAGFAALYIFMRQLHLLDTYLGLVILYTVGSLPLGVFFYASFMKNVPKELEESAFLDGANVFQTFWRIIFPILKPATGTLSLFVTLAVWNDVVNPVLFLTDESKFTIMPAILRLLGTYAIDPTLMFPAAVLASLPLIVLFLILQKQIVAGLTAGATKG